MSPTTSTCFACATCTISPWRPTSRRVRCSFTVWSAAISIGATSRPTGERTTSDTVKPQKAMTGRSSLPIREQGGRAWIERRPRPKAGEDTQSRALHNLRMAPSARVKGRKREDRAGPPKRVAPRGMSLVPFRDGDFCVFAVEFRENSAFPAFLRRSIIKTAKDEKNGIDCKGPRGTQDILPRTATSGSSWRTSYARRRRPTATGSCAPPSLRAPSCFSARWGHHRRGAKGDVHL